jgi:hypothetical protein
MTREYLAVFFMSELGTAAGSGTGGAAVVRPVTASERRFRVFKEVLCFRPGPRGNAETIMRVTLNSRNLG